MTDTTTTKRRPRASRGAPATIAPAHETKPAAGETLPAVIETLPALRETLSVITKSTAAAMMCPHFFIHQYESGIRRTVENESALLRTGNAFHAYRAAYAEHLGSTGKWSDAAFVEEWLANNNVDEDARHLIARDAEKWQINPESYFGAEVYLSVDAAFAPLEMEMGTRPPGSSSKLPNALLSGQIDLLLLDGPNAIILDPKSGFSVMGVSDDEPPIYASLVFAHFPAIETVEFVWDHVRIRASRRTSYSRAEDFGWMKDHVLRLSKAKAALLREAAAGHALIADPFSGLCVYCVLRCPRREGALATGLAFDTLQTDEQVAYIAGNLFLMEQYTEKARNLIRDYIAVREDLPNGQVRLGGDWVVENKPRVKTDYPAPAVLEQVLGLKLIHPPALLAALAGVLEMDPGKPAQAKKLQAVADAITSLPVPSQSPRYDVPLIGLTISASKLNALAKTKKSRGGVSRAGLSELLDSVGNRRPAGSVVMVHKVTQSVELETLLAESLAAAQENANG